MAVLHISESHGTAAGGSYSRRSSQSPILPLSRRARRAPRPNGSSRNRSWFVCLGRWSRIEMLPQGRMDILAGARKSVRPPETGAGTGPRNLVQRRACEAERSKLPSVEVSIGGVDTLPYECGPDGRHSSDCGRKATSRAVVCRSCIPTPVARKCPDCLLLFSDLHVVLTHRFPTLWGW